MMDARSCCMAGRTRTTVSFIPHPILIKKTPPLSGFPLTAVTDDILLSADLLHQTSSSSRGVSKNLDSTLYLKALDRKDKPKEEDAVEEVHQITHRAFMDVDIDKQRLGRIIIGLYGEVVPKTVEDFRALCTGEFGKGKSGKPLHYKGIPFHRIIPGFMIQVGDTVYGNGRGNESIYGGVFRDVNFKIKHSHAGPDSIDVQFFITTVKAYWQIYKDT
ncbi:hypothetical protein L2E82_18347 [Cichorium intybus]|uniref:Uncharacterized protein n=1 Tax=Cichorium intybus TaxID=13427 RepID=A0ACB9F977_CICIN|nr:hypothetical protein L2E82_18347 [Cichorium intybus]